MFDEELSDHSMVDPVGVPQRLPTLLEVDAIVLPGLRY